ncbi:MAG: universal stress protein [Rhodospirillales bacterium]|nr:universal stress protein [Rhodospirillales bacterium]
MYKNILLSVDLNDESSWKKALPTAVGLCQTSDASLRVLTVVPDFGMSIVNQYFPEGFEKEMAGKVMDTLKAFVKDNVPEGVEVQHIVGEGTIYEVILKMSEETKADLIVMASHRPELKDYLLGPNAARVVRHANCSVLVVRD